MQNNRRGAPVPTGNIEGLAGLLSAVLAQTANIQAADNAVDSKAHNLMAAALVVIALLGTQLRGAGGEWHLWTIVSMIILIVDVCIVIYLTRSREYAGAVVDLATHQDYFAKDDELLLAQLVEDANRSNDQNTVTLKNKNWLFRRAVILFLGGFAVGVGSLFVA